MQNMMVLTIFFETSYILFVKLIILTVIF